MFGLLKFGIKAGLASSAVYLSIDYGVWKDSDTTSKLYSKVSENARYLVTPLVEKFPVSLPELPQTGSTISTAQNLWNTGIKSSFRFIAAAPTCSVRYAEQGYEYIKEQVRILTDAETSKSP